MWNSLREEITALEEKDEDWIQEVARIVIMEAEEKREKTEEDKEKKGWRMTGEIRLSRMM